MDQFIIEGQKKLEGEIEILGVKNGILPMIVASILAEKGETVIRNVPNFRDVTTLSRILEKLGAVVAYDSVERVIRINCESLDNFVAPYDLVKQMRASFLVFGPLLSRFRTAEISLPGGCAIGARNVNMHIDALHCLGVKISQEEGYIRSSAESLKGAEFFFDYPTHTGTENIMMVACLAKGTARLINAASEPEIVHLAVMLNRMGAKITGAGTPFIEIEGVEKMTAIEIDAMPSRIETAFFMAAAAITNSELLIKRAELSNLGIVVDKMLQMGIRVRKIRENEILVSSKKQLSSIDFTTWPFPGFPTDFQPQMMALLTLSKGASVVKETVFENRLMHVAELNRMGADIKTSLNEAFVTGVKHLKGAPVMASDLQAGAGLVLAALAAEGKTIIDRVYHIDRGYERLEERLSSLKASIKRVNPNKKKEKP